MLTSLTLTRKQPRKYEEYFEYELNKSFIKVFPIIAEIIRRDSPSCTRLIFLYSKAEESLMITNKISL